MAKFGEISGVAELKEAPSRGNNDQKFSRVPRAHIVINSIQMFVHERQITWTRMVARDVMFFLAEQRFVDVNRDDPISVKASLLSMQRCLIKLGYKRGNKKVTMSI